jgi:hypothetical protein
MVHRPDHFGEFPSLEGLGQMVDHRLIGFLSLKLPDIGIEVVVAEVQDHKRKGSSFLDNLVGNPGPADGQPGPAGLKHLMVIQFYGVAVDLRLSGELLEEGTHGVVGCHLGEVDLGAPDEILVDPSAVLKGGNVAPGLAQEVQKLGLIGTGQRLLGQLHRPGRVLNNLHRLDPR